MEELELEFNLEQALLIQNNKERGRITTKSGNSARIVATDAKGTNPIIALVLTNETETPVAYTKEGFLIHNQPSKNDLVIKKPLTFNLEPFAKVLVRNCKTDFWQISLFSHYSNKGYATCINNKIWKECIPYNSDTKHLLNTYISFKYF